MVALPSDAPAAPLAGPDSQPVAPLAGLDNQAVAPLAGPDNQALIPLERELRERVAWFIGLRWLAAGAILVGGWVAADLLDAGLDPWSIGGVGLMVAAANLVFLALGRRHDRLPGSSAYPTMVYAQIGCDWAALGRLVQLTGGVRSPVILGLVFHLIIGALLLPRRACCLQAVLASLLVGFLVAGEVLGVWSAPAVFGAPLAPWEGLYRWGAITGFLGVTAFLTTSIAGNLRRKEEALFASEQAVERAYADLRVVSEERTWLARVTHHQLRSPLAAVQGLLDALRYAGPVTDKQAEIIERSRRRVREMLDLIRDLLDLAAAERLVPGQAAMPVWLLASLASSLEILRDRAAQKGVVVELATAARDVAVLADAGDVERVFANLLDNAVKYTPSGGQVTLTVRQQGNQVEAVVADTGIGVAPADQERIFSGFYRTQAAKDSGEVGTGVGLSIVRQLVRRWQGTVTLISSLGAGSRFVVTLPAAGDPAPPSRGDRE